MNPKSLEIAEAQCRLRLGPRHKTPISDDAVLTIGYHSGSDKSVLLTRARATKLRDWLNVWLEHGWEGVPQEDGQSTADVIDHFRDIAIRYQIERDRARTNAAREIDAALALIPAELRTVDLVKVAEEQSRHWAQLQAEVDALESFRLACVSLIFEIDQAGDIGADVIRKALHKFLDRHNHPKAKMLAVVPDAPIYDHEQLRLDFDTAEEIAA
ncbi:hypothetical protein ABT369_28380 [Dactylosporangium sp. NPDC000244]|uniref:hypothetical protein n=1 Tax=Dactylosporangium sp. NPDC000244 TaxID=3154365 RepID=UPI0033222BA1